MCVCRNIPEGRALRSRVHPRREKPILFAWKLDFAGKCLVYRKKARPPPPPGGPGGGIRGPFWVNFFFCCSNHVQKKVVEKNAVGIANIPRSIRQMNVAFSA